MGIVDVSWKWFMCKQQFVPLDVSKEGTQIYFCHKNVLFPVSTNFIFWCEQFEKFRKYIFYHNKIKITVLYYINNIEITAVLWI